MKELKYEQHVLTVEEVKKSIRTFFENKCDETFVEMIFNLLNSKVYIPAREELLLIINKENKIPKERMNDSRVLNKFYPYSIDGKTWLPIFLDKNINKEDLPKNAVIVETLFYYLCDLLWCKYSTLDGFIIDPFDIGIRFEKEHIQMVCELKELMDEEDIDY